MNLAVDPKNLGVKLVRSIANAASVDSGVLGVKQVAVDVVPQLGRNWEVVAQARVLRSHAECLLRSGGC
jgi:hypothetical protein